jgi:outer membrane protein OmpA-like peptidoglycan-associated protein
MIDRPGAGARSASTRAITAALAVLVTASVAACGNPTTGDPDTAPGVSVVVGAHANAPMPDLRGRAADLVDDAIRADGTLAVTSNPPDPAVARSGPVHLDCNIEQACEQRAAQRSAELNAMITSLRATAPESNLLEAISQAAAALADHPGPRTLVVLDSGLQTTGSLRFQDPGVLGADPDTLARYLAEQDELPDLRGLTVVLSGIGDVADPQQPLPFPIRRNLQQIWAALARAAGAADVQVLDTPLTAATGADLPPVTVVPVPLTDPSRCFGSLRETDVGFRPDSAELIDPALAAAALDPLAACLRDLNRPVTLTGTTASAGTSAGQIALSTQRAEAIKTELINRGVTAAAITTRGIGYTVPPCQPDRDSSGRLLPGPAAQNRQVIVEAQPT